MSLRCKWLSYHGQDVQALKAEVSSHIVPAKTLLSALDYSRLCTNHNTDNFYILSRFKAVSSPLSETENGPKIQARFVDFEQGSFFSVTFLKDVAIQFHELVNEKKLVSGNIVHFIRPLVAPTSKVSDLCFLVGSADGSDQIVHLWRQHSDLFIDSYPLFTDCGYQNTVFYGYDGTGSEDHALLNIQELIKDKGSVTSIDNFVNGNYSQNVVILGRYKKVVIPFGISYENKNKYNIVLISFEKVPIDQSCILFNSSSNLFEVYFFDNVSEDLDKSLKGGHLVPGDLVAICQPLLKKKIPKPTDRRPYPLQFSSNTNICLVILKDQHEKTTSQTDIFQLSHHHYPHYSEQGPLSVIKLNEQFSFNIKKFDILLFENLRKDQDLLLCIKEELSVNGDIVGLVNLAQRVEPNVKNCVILCCIFKILEQNRKRVIVFCREIRPSGVFGYFFNLFLHGSFGKKMCLTLREKQIIRGDVLALINPSLFPNNIFVSNSIQEGPFVLELSPRNSKQKIITYKVNRTDKVTTTIADRVPKILNKVCCECVRVQLDEEQQITGPAEVVRNNIDSRAQNDNLHSKCNIGLFGVSASKVASSSCQEVVPTKTHKINETYKDVLWIFPFYFELPNTGYDLDLVSGYCFLNCHKMSVYTTLQESAFKELLCPDCLLKVRLNLCFQLLGLSREGLHVHTILTGHHAERFLKITCSDFINDAEKRGAALNRLKAIVPERFSDIPRHSQHYKLHLSDVSKWWC